MGLCVSSALPSQTGNHFRNNEGRSARLLILQSKFWSRQRLSPWGFGLKHRILGLVCLHFLCRTLPSTQTPSDLLRRDPEVWGTTFLFMTCDQTWSLSHMPGKHFPTKAPQSSAPQGQGTPSGAVWQSSSLLWLSWHSCGAHMELHKWGFPVPSFKWCWLEFAFRLTRTTACEMGWRVVSLGHYF